MSENDAVLEGTTMELSEHEAQMMAESDENNMNNVAKIVFPNQQNKIEKDIPKVATLWDEEFQTITLHQANSESNNYEVIVAKPNDENDTSNVCISTAQEDSGTFVNFVNDYNDREDPTQPKKEITCPHCTSDCPNKTTLEQNLLMNTNEIPYKCHICFSKFKRSKSLNSHRLIHSGNKPVFKCDLCPTTCGRKTELRIHIEKFHTPNNSIKCKHCGDLFPDHYQHKIHSKTHQAEKYYKCELCPYVSMFLSKLNTHKLTHTGEKPFNCQHCDKSYRYTQSLRYHYKLVHNDATKPTLPYKITYQCNFCKRSFIRKGNYLRHLENHSQESTEND